MRRLALALLAIAGAAPARGEDFRMSLGLHDAIALVAEVAPIEPTPHEVAWSTGLEACGAGLSASLRASGLRAGPRRERQLEVTVTRELSPGLSLGVAFRGEAGDRSAGVELAWSFALR